MNTLCRIELLGGLRLLQGARVETRFRSQKTAQLLAYLAYYRKRPHSREVLIEMLWPECEPEAGRHSLSVALSSLRSQLDPAGAGTNDTVLVVDRHCAALNPAKVTTDVSDFEAALKCAAQSDNDSGPMASLQIAIELYAGELLPGYYDEWILPEQQRLNELYFQALRQAVLQSERDGDVGAALQYAIRWIGADRLCEEAHREVVRLYAAAGRPDAAMRQNIELERALQQNLEVDVDFQPPVRYRDIKVDLPSQQSHAIRSESDNRFIPAGDMATQSNPASSRIAAVDFEPAGGAVPLYSRFYVARPTDEEFQAAISRRDSIVLIKGARQVGKTSLLARGLQQARDAGCRVVLTHFQTFNSSHLQSAETLLQAIAELIADQLDLEVMPADVWNAKLGPNPNFRRYLRREVLSKISSPLVWALDEVDRIFSYPFAGEIFALFRSWHDERALEPGGPWARLTLAMAYSTEAHLFITDMNQSPFNVGTRLALEDFTMEQVNDLNRRYGSPLKNQTEVARYHGLVSGQPYLVCAGLHELAMRGVDIDAFETRAAGDDWIFGEHLRRIVALLGKNADLTEVVRGLLQGRPCPTRESFYRLRSAGILAGRSLDEARFRCPLYATYLAQHLL